MSVATLENQDLTLSSLTVSNAEYSTASGYVASIASITGSKTSTSLNVATVSAVNQLITPSLQLSLGGSVTSKPSLSTNSVNNLVVSTVSASGLTLSNPNGNTTLQQEVGYLECSSTLDAPIFQVSGGGATTKPYLSSNSANNCVVSTATGAGLTLSNGSGAFSLTPEAGYLASSGSLEVPQLQLTGSGSTFPPYLSTNSANNLVCSVSAGSGFTISSALGNGTLTVNGSNHLLWNGVPIS